MESLLQQFQEAKWFIMMEFSMSQQDKANTSLVHHFLHMSMNESSSGRRLIKIINLCNAFQNMRITSSWEQRFGDSMTISLTNQNPSRWEEIKLRNQFLLFFILQRNIIDQFLLSRQSIQLVDKVQVLFKISSTCNKIGQNILQIGGLTTCWISPLFSLKITKSQHFTQE